MKQQTELARMEHEAAMNSQDNETKILVATIAANVKAKEGDADTGIQEPMSEEARTKLREQIREFDARLALDKERLAFEKDKAKTDAKLKEKQINKKSKTN
jgi:hypothetical protein